MSLVILSWGWASFLFDGMENGDATWKMDGPGRASFLFDGTHDTILCEVQRDTACLLRLPHHWVLAAGFYASNKWDSTI